MLSRYIGGIVELTKDALRLAFYLLKRPHYIVLLLGIVIGVFYLNGIPPHEISGFVSGKWQAFVENRKQTFREDMEIVSNHFKDEKKAPAKSKEPESKQVERREETEDSYLREEADWKKAFEAAQKEIEISGENVIEGALSVVSAGEIRLNDRSFLLKVRIRPGKGAEAYQQMMRRFDGRNAKCVPDKDNDRYAECFVGVLGVSEALIDFNLADPI